MAYINDEKKQKIKNSIENYIESSGYKDQVKYSLRFTDFSTANFVLLQGPFKIEDFYPNDYDYSDVIRGHIGINHFHYSNNVRGYDGKKKVTKAVEFIENIITALNTDNYDDSDIQTDYFNVGHYINCKIGTYETPYINNNEMTLKQALENVKKLKERKLITEQVEQLKENKPRGNKLTKK